MRYKHTDRNGDRLIVWAEGEEHWVKHPMIEVDGQDEETYVYLPTTPEGVEEFVRAVLAVTGCVMSYSTSPTVHIVKHDGGNA